MLVAVLGAVAVLIWLGILFHPARPWDFRPVGDAEELPPAPPAWPSVCALVPARNEAESLPRTLPALLQQAYPGHFAVVLIDDRSEDGTADIAQQVAAEAEATERLRVLSGTDLPAGWVGKVWALEQGAGYCGVHSGEQRIQRRESCPLTSGKPDYFLLTDADIHHAPRSLQRLVAESEKARLALNSRMARLRCVSRAERLLIPPFVFFFTLLYPLRWVNDPRRTVAAAAGGCVLVTSSALERIGSFACISNQLIDDVNLAQHVKRLGVSIRLSLSRNEIESLRVYESFAAIWAMVRRTAFTELRYSWVRLVGTVMGLSIMFLLPLMWVIGGGGVMLSSLAGWSSVSPSWAVVVVAEGLWAWVLMVTVYRPAVRFFGLSNAWAWTLPLAGICYGAMTVDSAFRHWIGLRTRWRDD